MATPRQTSAPAGRPSFGAGHYLRDLTYGALDGAITTMAVVAGTAGAHLPARVGIILGLANLLADGLSMGASNYLSLKSELEQSGASVAEEAPWRHGLASARGTSGVRNRATALSRLFQNAIGMKAAIPHRGQRLVGGRAASQTPMGPMTPPEA